LIAGLTHGAAPPLYFLRQLGTPRSLIDKILRFELAGRVRPNAAAFRDYDPARPLLKLESAAYLSGPFGDSVVDAVVGAAGALASGLGGLVGGAGGDVASAVSNGVSTAIDVANALTG